MKTHSKVFIFTLICIILATFLFYEGIIESSQKLVVCGAIFTGLSVAGMVKLYNPD